LHWSFVWSVIPTGPVQPVVPKKLQVPVVQVAVGAPHVQAPQPRVSSMVPTLFVAA
jgi:hypothetical protein